ncbi:MAG: helix-turn-helix transcriptional regulator [Solirubrobacteraceae bacterium]
MTSIIRDARLAQGLTQAQLSKRLGISQPSVARIEAAGDAVTVATLRRTLNALGRGLVLQAVEQKPSYDESLLRSTLRIEPGHRLAVFEAFYDDARELAAAGARARAAA